MPRINPEGDIIADAIRLLGDSLTREQRIAVEIELRQEFGGKSFYIRKTSPDEPIEKKAAPKRTR